MMFNDARSKKIIFISHCILNQNSISDGTADFPSSIKDIVDLVSQSEVGIVQMPCPELNCLGLDRGDVHGAERPVIVENTRIRKAMDEPTAFEKLVTLADNIIYQIEQYLKYGFAIKGIVGINRSPSCGVDTTSDNNKEIEGEGVFIKLLREKLNKKNIHINMVGIKGSEIDTSLNSLHTLLN